jgi:segregation and condensation protein A
MQEVDVSHIAPIRINVRDYVDRLMGILREREEISFVEFTRECSNKLEVIVSFLAMLELYKWELVDVKQAIRFGDILISRKKDLVKEDLGEYYQDFYAHM